MNVPQASKPAMQARTTMRPVLKFVSLAQAQPFLLQQAFLVLVVFFAVGIKISFTQLYTKKAWA